MYLLLLQVILNPGIKELGHIIPVLQVENCGSGKRQLAQDNLARKQQELGTQTQVCQYSRTQFFKFSNGLSRGSY